MGFFGWIWRHTFGGSKPKKQYDKKQIKAAYEKCKSKLDEFGKFYDAMKRYVASSLADPVLKIIATLEKLKKEIDSEYAKIPKKSKYKRMLDDKIEINNTQFAKLPKIKKDHSEHR
tara:strand:+ start:72 stop:419 length:348 start_codon:yes stop_codon:yes gene_type:complete